MINMKKMEPQNLQHSCYFMAVQLYLLLELKSMLLKLSEGPWSLVLINEKYTASGKEINYVCVFQNECYTPEWL